MEVKFEILKGKTLKSIKKVGDDEIIFTLKNGDKYKLYHTHECCEEVYIEDICGDLKDLVDVPILMAEESTSDDKIENKEPGENNSITWTFYKLATIRGYATIRWYGISNGYYSESVDFEKIRD